MSAKSFLPIAFHQNEWKNFHEANLSIATHALHYGTGAFWGMRAIPNPANPGEILLFRLADHARRLAESATFLMAPYTSDFFETKIREFVEKNPIENPIYIRPFLYTSDLDLSPRLHNIEWDFLIYGLEMGDYLKSDGISCTVSSWRRQADASFPLRGKISWAYITSALAKTEAYNRGFDEAILMNEHGKVAEWSAMNIFVVRKWVIKTPPVTEDILEWITRDSVIQIARSLGYSVVEAPIDKSELLVADEVFFTGTAARVTPVAKIEQYILPTDRPISTKIKAKFDLIVRGEDKEFDHWITRITK